MNINKPQTPYIVLQEGGRGMIRGRMLTPGAPLPADWVYPVLVYFSLPANAVEDGSAPGFWVVEFLLPETGFIVGRSSMTNP